MGAVMLGIDGNQFCGMPADGFHHQFPARNQNLFVCEPDPLARAYRSPGCREPCDAYDRGHDSVSLRRDRDPNQCVRARQQFGERPIRYSKIGKPRSKPIQVRRFLDDRNFRPKLLNLLCQQLDVSSGGQGEHLKPGWVLTDDIQSIGSDGTRRT